MSFMYLNTFCLAALSIALIERGFMPVTMAICDKSMPSSWRILNSFFSVGESRLTASASRRWPSASSIAACCSALADAATLMSAVRLTFCLRHSLTQMFLAMRTARRSMPGREPSLPRITHSRASVSCATSSASLPWPKKSRPMLTRRGRNSIAVCSNSSVVICIIYAWLS